MTHPDSRRSFLKLAGTTLAAAGFNQAFGSALVSPAARAISHAPILDLAATAEALSVTFYQHALAGATFRMNPETAQLLRGILAADQAHLDLLSSLGGRPVTTSFALDKNLASDAGVFAETGLELKRTFVGAYIAASYELAAAGQAELAATAAQLAANESSHLTLLSQLTGFGPGELSLPRADFAGLESARAALARFVGQAGPSEQAIALPSRRQVLALTGKAAQEPVAFFHTVSQRSK